MSRILTYTGRMFDVAAPNPKDVDLTDIAHALSNLCRFTGHVRYFYSVAQHSILVASLLPPELRLLGLLHDAHEAYIQDLATPLKDCLPGYRRMEQPVWAAVARRFRIPEELPAEVKHADLVALATEKRDLMPEHYDPWPVLEGIKPAAERIDPFDPATARAAFLATYKEVLPAYAS